MRWLRILVLVTGGVLVPLAGSPTATDVPLAFGVLNQQSPALTAERWNPILHHVSSVTGVPLRLKMGATVQETNFLMSRGQFDFVYTNHNFQTAYDGIGYRVIARWAGDPISAVIAVPEGSPIKQVRELDGKRVAFPSRDAFVGYAVPTMVFRREKITVQEVFGANQEGTLAQLKAGRVDAAAVNSRFLAQYMSREGVRFREIFVSEPYPDLAIIVHPRVPAATVEKVRRALLDMKDDPVAAPVLAKVQFKGFTAATDRDYDGVRQVYRLAGQ